MSCRDEVLACAEHIVRQKGQNRFSIKEIIKCMRISGTAYAESTIRTHVVSRMGADSPRHHAVTFDDFERIARGIYRMKRT